MNPKDFQVPEVVVVKDPPPTNDKEIILSRYGRAAQSYNARKESEKTVPSGVKELAALLFSSYGDRGVAEKGLQAAVDCLKEDLKALEAAQRWVGSLP
jgi:hypothetical protein